MSAYRALLLTTLVVLAMLTVAHGQPVSAAGFTVDSWGDLGDASPGDGACDIGWGPCTLRAAIQETNALPGADTIILPTGTQTLDIAGTDENAAATGDLDIAGDLTITGPGADTTVIDGGAIDRVFHVLSGVSAAISGVTVQNGSSSYGGGIYNSGTLTLTGTSVNGNNASNAGGLYNLNGTLSIVSSTISGNTAGVGGGVYIMSGTLTITNSTVSGNTSSGSGGGIVNQGTASLTNSTVNGNTGEVAGGGIWQGSGATSSITLKNTIVANSPDGGDCTGAITSGGHNLDSDGSCGLSGPGDLSNVDPQLEPLTDNGGPTLTHALQSGSPAIDAGDNAGCPPTDQRGVGRPQGPVCDIGAYESESPGLTQGDVDCSGGVTSVDALKQLRHVASLIVSQNEPCPDIETEVASKFGDVDCDNDVDSVDALKVLRHVAGLPVAQHEPCPDIGTGLQTSET